jgi:hypothetical protein
MSKLLVAAQALLAGVNQVFDKTAAVSVHFNAGVWPAFVTAVNEETAAPAPAVPAANSQWNRWKHHRHERHHPSTPPPAPAPVPAATSHRWKRGPWKAGRAP